MNNTELEMHRRVLEQSLKSAQVSLRTLAEFSEGDVQQQYQTLLTNLRHTIQDVHDVNRTAR